MKFDLRRNEGSEEETIEFLNSNAKKFFNGDIKFADTSYMPYIRGSILNCILQIERVMYGMFNCDIFMKNAKVEQLKKMFPNGTRIFGVEEQNDVVKIGRFFDILRNATAHVINNDKDFFIFTFDFSNLRFEKKFNDKIVYENSGKLTMAGLIFIILNFLREKSIYSLTKLDNIFSVVSAGERRIDKGEKFVAEISHTDLTINIRTHIGDSVVSSICGEYAPEGENTFNIAVGSPNNPVFKVDGKYENKILTIEEDSLTQTYYDKRYVLKIIEEKLFIELSNKLPPMAFVDLLFLLKIKKFDKRAYKKITKKFDTNYEKLNHPKFYVDKNIDYLLLPPTNSDYRLVSSTISSGLISIIQTLEYNIITSKQIKIKNNYSNFKSLLAKANVPKHTIEKAAVLRNFVMHGYLFNEHVFYNDNYYKFSFEFCINTLIELVKYFKTNDIEIYNSLARTINQRLIGKLCNAKYTKCIETTIKYIQTDRQEKLLDDLIIKNGFINNSFYDLRVFNKLSELCNGSSVINCYDSGSKQKRLYTYSNNKFQEDLMNKYLVKKNLIVKRIKNEGVITTFKIVSK